MSVPKECRARFVPFEFYNQPVVDGFVFERAKPIDAWVPDSKKIPIRPPYSPWTVSSTWSATIGLKSGGLSPLAIRESGIADVTYVKR